MNGRGPPLSPTSPTALGVTKETIRKDLQLLAGPGLSVRDALESVLEGLKEGQEGTGILFGVILCSMRGHITNSGN